jgi:hypothetical protein
MLIAKEQNRFYNAMLNDIRPSLYPDMGSKEFRTKIKDLDPEFPLDEDGNKKSMRDVTEPEWKTHVMFIKRMAIKRGVIVSSFSEENLGYANSVVLKAGMEAHYEEDGDCIIVNVICSSCGASTLRKLTEERFEELSLIANGEKDEELEKIVDSFICIDCMNIKIQKGEI